MLGGRRGGQLGAPKGCVRPSLRGVVHEEGGCAALKGKAAAEGGSPRGCADWTVEQQASKLLLGAGLQGNLEFHIGY